MEYAVPNSFLIVDIVAIHGVYNKQKISSDNALLIDKNAAIFIGSRTCNVDTTVSFARKPVISDTVIRQSLNPNGLKIGAIMLAIFARIDCSTLLTICKLYEKFCKNHTAIEAMNIMPNALCKKSLAFSHKSCDTVLILGKR